MSDRYQELKKNYIKGWRTWNVRSVLSHVHMPDGFAVNIAFKEYREGHYLKETLIGRFVNEYGREPGHLVTDMEVSADGISIRAEGSSFDARILLLYQGDNKIETDVSIGQDVTFITFDGNNWNFSK